MSFARLVGVLLLATLPTACGGGGSGQTLPALPPSGAAPVATSHLVIGIVIPAPVRASAGARRSPLYVSAGTESAAVSINGGAPIVVNLAAGSANCTALASGARSCTVGVSASVGVDTFAETLYSGLNATGSVLSQGTTSATVAAGQANTVLLVLDGAIASLSLALANTTPPVGTAASIGLTVNFNDASGAAIIGNDPFVNPVTLTDSDGSGATTLSKTTLRSPADAAALTLGYSGAQITRAVIGASAGSVVAPSVALSPVSPTGFNDYVTYGYDNGRGLFNPNSTAITPSTLAKLHLAWQTRLGGGDFSTQTQPILATKVPGHAGVLYVGGGSGNVYAIDAQNGSQLWKTGTGQETYTCDPGSGTIDFGVAGSAAYDPASGSIYVVGNVNSSVNAYSAAVLYRLDAASGQILGRVNVTPSSAGPTELNFAHTSVTLQNGIAYVGTGATCDISSWRGRVVAVNVPAMTIENTFFTVWDPANSRGQGSQSWGGGGVWGWGGVSIDSSGDVVTGVGNADNGISNGTIAPPFVSAPQEYSGYGDSLLKLTPTLSGVLADNHPIPLGTFSRTADDMDVQGTPLIFTPNGAGCGPMTVVQGKSGELTLYNETGINEGAIAQFQLSPPTSQDGYLGDPAYSPATGLVYAPVASSQSPTLFNPGLVAIDPGCGHPAVAWHAAFGVDSTPTGVPRSAPAVSAGGVVFAGTVDGGGGDLWALDASSGSLLTSGPLLRTNGNLRMPATIDGDWVFVIDNNGDLYGLTTDPAYRAISATVRAVSPAVLYRRHAAPGP